MSALRRTLKEKETALEALESDRSQEAAAASERARESTVKLKDAVRQASKTERELKAIMEQDRANEVEMLRSAVNRLEEEISRHRSGAVVPAGQKPALSTSTRDTATLEAELERNVNEVETLRRAVEDEKAGAAEAKAALDELRTLYSQAQEDLEDLRAGSSLRPSDRASPTDEHLGDDLDALQLELSSARAQIRSLEDECFHSEQTRVKMLKANGDLKGQIESLQDALDKERAKPSSPRASSSSSSLNPTSPAPPAAPVPPSAGPSSSSSSPGTSRGVAPPPSSIRGHAHRRTASVLPSVTEIDDVAPGLFPPAPPPPLSDEAPFLPSSAGGGGHRSTSSRHVRQASLSLLKQRMEDEFGTASRPSDGRIATTGSAAARARRVPLSNDLLWCASCTSRDLFVV